MPSCAQHLEKRGVEITGFSKSDSSYVACMAAQYCKGYQAGESPAMVEALVKGILSSRFGDELSKSVLGGIQHVISVDNAASYAELWHKGGNWYAVTGADMDKATGAVSKGGIYEVAGISKGMPIREAVPRFLEAVFGPSKFSKGCGCKG